MTEHYTKNTESVTAWCNFCNRQTQHAVSNGRRGRCMEHQVMAQSKRQKKQREQNAAKQRQPRLFP